MDAENIGYDGCSQRDSAEHKGYVRAHRSFNRIWKERDSAQPDLLGKILEKDNLNRAFKRVKANKGAPGADGMMLVPRELITPRSISARTFKDMDQTIRNYNLILMNGRNAMENVFGSPIWRIR